MSQSVLSAFNLPPNVSPEYMATDTGPYVMMADWMSLTAGPTRPAEVVVTGAVLVSK